MISRARAHQLRAMIEKASASLPDEDALEAVELFPAWMTDTAYTAGIRVRYGDNLYRCEQAHTSQADWTPDKTPALYTPIGLDEAGYPVWSQPTGAHDAYQKGDVVNYQGVLYRSEMDGNIYSPEAYAEVWTVCLADVL